MPISQLQGLLPGERAVPIENEYRISLNIDPGVYFLLVSFDPVLKQGRPLNRAGIYNKMNVRYSRILLGFTPNSLAAAFDFFSAVSTAFSLKEIQYDLCFDMAS